MTYPLVTGPIAITGADGHVGRALQERLARRGAVVTYDVTAEEGPPHERRFDVAAIVEGEELARGAGRSKKDAEQAAAFAQASAEATAAFAIVR